MKVEKTMKTLTEECKSATNKLQEHVTKMKHAHDYLEQYGCHLSMGEKCTCQKRQNSRKSS